MDGSVHHDITVGTKRGSEELFSSVTNGPYIMNTTANGSDSKKFKGDCSRVLHIRKLPNDITEGEVISLGLPFGDVSNLLMLKAKNQAFLEMQSEEAAENMVEYYSSVLPVIRLHPVYVQFSNHKHLNTDNSPNQERAQAALRALSSSHLLDPTVMIGGSVMSSAGALMSPGGCVMSSAGSVMSSAGSVMSSAGAMPHSSVLRVVVENLVYPVSLDALSQIFSKFGSVLRIIVFTKNSQFQALLQYPDCLSAQAAKVSLDGQNIYNGCCTLRISFSKLTSLNVKYNNDKSRDYTRPDLPPGDAVEHPMAFTPGIISASPYGGAAFPPTFTLQPAMSMCYPGLSMPLSLPASRLGYSALTVLLVSNLNPERVSPHCLFILFGVYGDVMRVKILFNKKENALVQMADSTQAQLAMSHLSGQTLHGKPLRISPSKHSCVQLPREGHEDQGLTRDYSCSSLHRFKKPGSKNYCNIYPPSSTLHLSNIPPCVVEEDLKLLFSSSGATVNAFKFFTKDHKMALVQMGSVEEAIEALIEFHNHDLGESHHLRVSFSKSSI